MRLSLSPGLSGLVSSQQQCGDVWEGGGAPLYTGPQIKYTLYIQSACCKGLLNLQAKGRRAHRNTLRLALLTRSTSLSRWRKLITQMSSDWPQNCVSLWPWGWAAPPPDRVCYRARESWCLKKQVNVTDPDMQRKGLFKQSMHCLLFIKICTEQCILELTFPYRRQQVQTAVRVQGLQQVPHSLRVGVVELQKQDIRKGS